LLYDLWRIGEVDVKAPRLRAVRQSRGYSQESLAAESQVTRSTIARIETGHEAHPTTLRKLAITLGVQVVDLMGDEDAAALRRLVEPSA